MPLARGSQIVAVWVVLTGCTLMAPPGLAIGPCELTVTTLAGGESRRIDPPYRVRMATGAVLAEWGPSEILYTGTGWKLVHVTVTGPDGDLRAEYDVPGDNFSSTDDGPKLPIDEPGVWRFRLSDGAAGCVREFSVEGQPS
jgi:hypothetical protein